MVPEPLAREIDAELQRLVGQLPADGYLVQQLASASAYFCGYDAVGRIALVGPSEGTGWPPVDLARLRFTPAIRTKLTDMAGRESHRDVAVLLIDATGSGFETLIPSLLAGVIAAAGNDPAPGDLGKAVRALRDIFQALGRGASESYLGIWGELFVMSVSSDARLMAAAWGADPTQTFDFALEGERLEVKTTLQATRRHHFSYAQLVAAERSEVFVASLQTAHAPDGATALDLLNKVLRSLAEDSSLISVVMRRVTAGLGSDLLDPGASTFDRHLAKDSLALFHFEEVPAVTVAPGVVDVEWIALLPSRPAIATRNCSFADVLP